MLADNLAKGEHEDGKKEGSEHRDLGDALFDRDWGGIGVCYGDKLFPVAEI